MILRKRTWRQECSIDPQGRYRIFQKILTPSKITLPLHRFIKKFLKNIPAY